MTELKLKWAGHDGLLPMFCMHPPLLVRLSTEVVTAVGVSSLLAWLSHSTECIEKAIAAGPVPLHESTQILNAIEAAVIYRMTSYVVVRRSQTTPK